jgi:hypothetical protein
VYPGFNCHEYGFGMVLVLIGSVSMSVFFTHIFVLQDDDAINAEVFIKKASFLVNNCRDEALNLQYKVSFVLNSGNLLLDNLCSAA